MCYKSMIIGGVYLYSYPTFGTEFRERYDTVGLYLFICLLRHNLTIDDVFNYTLPKLLLNRILWMN